MLSLAALLVGLGLLAAPPAAAQLGRALDVPAPTARPEAPRNGPAEWAFDLTASTSLPVSVGVDGTLTHASGAFAHASFGHTPNAYLSAVADVLGDAEVYLPRGRPLIDEIIADGAWNVRIGVGYTLPEGLEVSLGYTVLTTSASLSPGAVEQATLQPFRWPGMTEVPLSITAHAIHGRIGWRFLVEEHLVLRAALGWAHTVAFEAGVTVPEEVRALPEDPAGAFEEELAEGFRSYGFTPELIVGAGYRL